MADETNEDDSWLYGSSNIDAAGAEGGNIATNGKESDEHGDQADGDAAVCLNMNLQLG